MQERDNSSGDPYSEESLSRRLDALWSEPAVAAPPESRRRIGDYWLKYPIGGGAFGLLFLGEHIDSGRPAAVKIPRPEVFFNDEIRERFSSEIAAVRRLSHPSIVSVTDSCDVGPTPYIVSEFCAGPNLREWLHEKLSLADLERGITLSTDWKAVCEHVIQMAEGIQYAHENGVYHRDIKPENVLLFPQKTEARELHEFEPRLTDFGLAQLAASNPAESRSSVVVGTAWYMAPEQIEGTANESMAAQGDVYSLGVVMFEMLTGSLPTRGRNYWEVLNNARNGNKRRLNQLRPDVPSELDAVCQVCLERNPHARYDTAADLIEDLQALLAGNRPALKKLPITKRVKFWAADPRWLTVAGWYTFWAHAVIGLWLTIGMTFAVFHFASQDISVSKLVTQTAVILTTMHLPTAWFGWKTKAGKRWAVYAGLVMALACISAPVITLANDVVFFQEIYGNARYFVVVVHLFLTIVFVIQFVLYLIAFLSLPRRTDQGDLVQPE